jgi:hypothetical protein
MNFPEALEKPAARIDLAACYVYIGERSPDATRRFHFAAEATPVRLARSSGSGAQCRALQCVF